MSTENKNNTPDTSAESIRTKNKTKPIDGLVRSAIEQYFGSPIRASDYNRYVAKKDGVYTAIKDIMKSLKAQDGEEWGGIDTKKIDAYNHGTLSEKILYHSQEFLIKRKKTLSHVLTKYPALKTPENTSSLLGVLSTLDSSDLDILMRNNGKLKSLIKKTFPKLDSTTVPPQPSFIEIFRDLDTLSPTEEEKKFIRDVEKNYKYKVYPDSEEIAQILSIYRRAPVMKKRAILDFFSAAVPISIAYKNDIIDNTDVNAIAVEYFGDTYGGLNTDEKTTFLNSLIYSDDITIDTQNILRDATIDKLYDNPEARKNLAEDILQKAHIDNKEETPQGTISSQMKEAVQKLKDEDGNETDTEEDIEQIDVFRRVMTKNLANIDNPELQSTLKNLKKGSTIRFGKEGDYQYFSIAKTTDKTGDSLEVENGLKTGLLIEGLPMKDGIIINTEEQMMSYDALGDFFQKHADQIKIYSEAEFEKILTSASNEAGKNGKIYDARQLEEEVSEGNIASKIDIYDTEGRAYGFSKGTIFLSPDEEGIDKIWEIAEIGKNGRVSIRGPEGGIQDNFELSDFVELAKAGKLKRTNQITLEHDFLHALEVFGVSHHAKIEKNLLIEEHEDHGKKTTHTVRVFGNKETHIRVGGIEDGIVYFGEYDAEDSEKARKYAEKYGTEKASKQFYTAKSLSYGAFLDYLAKNKLEAGGEDIIDPHAHEHGDHHEHHHYHLDKSFISRMGQMQSFNSMWKGMEMIWHSIEHSLEKGTKLDAAKFAMRMGKFLPLGDGIEAQIYADIVDESKSITEKYKNKIINLPGPKARWKCIHIAHNEDARPEEVSAAIQYMVSSYGHLYSEDIKHYQTIVSRANLRNRDYQYHFLDAFIRSNRLGDIVTWREKSYVKAISEMGDLNNHEGEPTEEQLIHALMKSIDGNADQFPYAASVVKGMGGPGGFENDWKFKGFEDAYEKGKKQTTMVNAQGRLNKAIGFLATHEIYKGMGAMEQVAAKAKDPKMQAFPFIWAVGGYTKYASPQALQKLKGYAGNGISFHAYAFLREEEDNRVYRETVRLALGELAKQGKIKTEALGEFDGICARLDRGPEDADVTEKKYNKVSAPAAMMKFWQLYQDTGLNDMLQNKNGWLTKIATENKTAKAYRNKLSDAHQEQLSSSNIPNEPTGWYDELGYQNMIMGDKDGLKSLERQLIKLRFDGRSAGGGTMNKDDKIKNWDFIVRYMKDGMRDEKMFLGDTVLQKNQFLLHRAEIIQYFAEKLQARSVASRGGDIKKLILDNIRTYPYYQDMIDMGIDPEAVFDESIAKKNAESDYENWVNNRQAGSLRKTQSVIERMTYSVNNKIGSGGAGTAKNTKPWVDPDMTSEGIGGNDNIPFEDSD